MLYCTHVFILFADDVKLNRPLPSFLERGQPNLIVCSQGEPCSKIFFLCYCCCVTVLVIKNLLCFV